MIISNINEFEDYMKANWSMFKTENEIIKEKLSLGINGLEWLILQVVVDDNRRETMNDFINFYNRKYPGGSLELIIKDAVTMDNEAFYEKHKLNWWISIDESLTFLSILKNTNYDKYFYLLQWMYDKQN